MGWGLGVLAAGIASLFSRTARHIFGWAVALAQVAVVAVVWIFLQDSRRKAEVTQRLDRTEVQLDGLQLAPGSGAYRLRGFVRNLSPRYTLTSVTFELIAQDCEAGHCREQGRGHAEVIRQVRPGQTIGFDTEVPRMPRVPKARGEQRLSYHVSNTWALR